MTHTGWNYIRLKAFLLEEGQISDGILYLTADEDGQSMLHFVRDPGLELIREISGNSQGAATLAI